MVIRIAIGILAFAALLLGCEAQKEPAEQRVDAIPHSAATNDVAIPEKSMERSADRTTQGRQVFERVKRELAEFEQQHGAIFEGGLVPLHYLDLGGDGIPLVLLHGTYNTAYEFVPFAKPLIEAGYRPISVDWYGHGKTPIPSRPVSIRDFAKDLTGLMDSLGLTSAVIAGHSRGGMIATEFYDAYPQRTLGVILIDGGASSPHDYFLSLGKEGLHNWMLAAFDPDTGQALAPTYQTEQELFLAGWEQWDRTTDSQQLFEIIAQAKQRDDGQWTQWRQSIRRWLQQDNLENTFNGMHRPQQGPLFLASCVLQKPREIYRELTVPLLILDAAGRDDRYRDTTPTQANQALQQDNPDRVQHYQFPTGHYLHREQPQQFLKHVIDFRKRAAP